MINLIAETAWHHEGDFSFMKDLISEICANVNVGFVKMHITLDLDEYMNKDHEAYSVLQSWLFSKDQWSELINIVRDNGKQVMLLLNDVKAIEFASQFNPEAVEIHSVCLNVPRLQDAILLNMPKTTKIVVGVGGCTLEEVDQAVSVFGRQRTVLMFGFQNYPTKYKDINLEKIRKVQRMYPGVGFGYADHTAWDESNNELITLLVAANNMEYLEKHVTTHYGKERCDYSSAISIGQLNSLAEKVEILNNISGTGSLDLSQAEKSYSTYGPMKMAAVAKHRLEKGDTLSIDQIQFCRTSQISNISQIEMLKFFGLKIVKNIEAGEVITRDHLDKVI